MDDLLGYPTEYQRERIVINLTPGEQARYRFMASLTTGMGYHSEELDNKQLRELVPFAGENALSAQYFHFGGHANPQRSVQAYAWALQDHGGQYLPALQRRRFFLQQRPGYRSAGTTVAISAATRW